MELAGLAFACQKGFSPEEYARHLWGKGAARWMGKDRPDAGEYLLKEAEAYHSLFPDVSFEVTETGQERAELVFTKGCLGWGGKEPWKLARSLGLAKKDVCRYCQESFRLWAGQLGLNTEIGQDKDKICRLRVVKEKPATRTS